MATPMHGSHLPGGNHRQADLDEELAADGLDLTPARDEIDVPGLATAEDLEGRSQLAIYLLPSAFPAAATTLIEVAQNQDAPPEILERLGLLPTTPTYHTVEEVWEALGGPSESRTFEPQPEPTRRPPATPGRRPEEGVMVEPERPVEEEHPSGQWVDAVAVTAGHVTERTVRILLGAPVRLVTAVARLVPLPH